jgi:hypothetical protein
LAGLLLAACVGTTTETTVGEDPVTSDTTVVTTPDTSVPESFVWPTVRAANFIHRSGGAVYGVPTAPLSSITCYACATVTLGDGRVLVVGAAPAMGYSAEIWDPETGLWTSTGKPNSALDSMSAGPPYAVLLRDGQVLVTLGTFQGSSTGTGVEIYDPVDGSFRELGSVLSYWRVPVVMSDGRVLLASSRQGGDVFDPADETMSPVGETPSDVSFGLSAVALSDGRVLLVEPSGAAVYDAETDQFTSVDLVYPTEQGTAAALLHDGRVLLTGGENWSYDDPNLPQDLGSAQAQVFDPATDRFTAVGSMLEPRSDHTAVTLADGRMVIVGGGGDRVEVFDPETATFQRAPLLTRPRNNPSVALLDDGNLLVVGGSGDTPSGLRIELIGVNESTTPRTAEIYHPDHRAGEPSAESLSGFTMFLEVDLVGEAKRPSGDLSVLMVVPPGGLEGATSGQVGGGSDRGCCEGPIWFYPEGVVPGAEFWGDPEQLKRLPADCEEGCEIRAMLFETADLTSTLLVVQFTIQYEGDIPQEAAGITLTVVEEEGS